MMWEYRVMRSESLRSLSKEGDQEILDVMGENGWELVAVTEPNESTVFAKFYFKRPKTLLCHTTPAPATQATASNGS